MKKLVAATLSSMAIVTLCVGMIAMDARPSLGKSKQIEITWGHLKCCFITWDCCATPKKKGLLGLEGDWVPAFLDTALRQALHIVVR